MKCSCDAELSFNSDAGHLAMNSPGVIASTATTRTRADSADTSRARKTRHRSSKRDPSVLFLFRSPCSGLAERASSAATARPMIITDRREQDDDLLAAPIAARGSLRNA